MILLLFALSFVQPTDSVPWRIKLIRGQDCINIPDTTQMKNPLFAMRHACCFFIEDPQYYKILPHIYFSPKRLFSFWKYKRPRIIKKQ